MKRFKKICLACNSSHSKITKEHFWPKWLIKFTGAHKANIRWLGESLINPFAATVPLCFECNNAFGIELEGPVSEIFQYLEDGHGISDNEAELLIRWLWKIQGIAWLLANPGGIYTTKYTLRDRVLRPIDNIRNQLLLTIGLADEIDHVSNNVGALGMNSTNTISAIFAAGVFSKIAIMVSHEFFTDKIPNQFSKYRLAQQSDKYSDAKLFYPKKTFKNDTEAIHVICSIADNLSHYHDLMAEIANDIAGCAVRTDKCNPSFLKRG